MEELRAEYANLKRYSSAKDLFNILQADVGIHILTASNSFKIDFKARYELS